MGTIVAGFASSHAFTFMEPSTWPQFREKNRASYEKRIGSPAAVPAGLAEEDVTDLEARFERIRSATRGLRELAIERDLDALVIVGDDQNENLTEQNMPQLAVYTGGAFRTGGHFARGDSLYRPHTQLARTILEHGVESGFDIASIGGFEDDRLTSHAHAQILDEVFHDLDIPVVIVFMNAIHHPAVPPRRCYAVGEMIRAAVERSGVAERVGIYASGGLSHYTAGYPWSAYEGTMGHGDIDIDFDHKVVDLLNAGQASELADLTSADLLDHGAIELRAWICLAGSLGDLPPDVLVYEPFYHAIMGMGVASWRL